MEFNNFDAFGIKHGYSMELSSFYFVQFNDMKLYDRIRDRIINDLDEEAILDLSKPISSITEVIREIFEFACERFGS